MGVNMGTTSGYRGYIINDYVRVIYNNGIKGPY